MAKNDLGGVWRTVGGRRIFIKDGEDLETAMKKSGKFGNKNIINEEKINNKLNELYEKTKNENKEIMQILDIDGNILSEQEGIKDNVSPNINAKMIITDSNNKNKLVIIHNHPDNSSFSINDVSNYQSNLTTNTICVVGKDGEKYILEFNDKRIKTSTLKEQYANAENKYKSKLKFSEKYSFKEYQKAVKENRLNEFQEQMKKDKENVTIENKIYTEKIWEDISKQNGWTFKKKK